MSDYNEALARRKIEIVGEINKEIDELKSGCRNSRSVSTFYGQDEFKLNTSYDCAPQKKEIREKIEEAKLVYGCDLGYSTEARLRAWEKGQCERCLGRRDAELGGRYTEKDAQIVCMKL